MAQRSRRSVLGLLGLTVIAFFVRANDAQELPCTSRKMAVSFRDGQNLPLGNVSVADLEAKLHGKQVKLVSLAPDSRPHRIVLVIDNSGSMATEEGDPALWPLGISLATHFFQENRERAQIAILFFNSQVTDEVHFAQGNPAVGEKLQQVAQDPHYERSHIRGKTALRDAIFQATLLLDHPTSADAIYVLTDGGDNASHESAAELDRRLAVTSVRVFAVLLYRGPPYRDRTPEEETGPRDLADMAHKTGGEILTAAEWRGKRVALSANADARVNSEEMLNRLYKTIFQDQLLEIELPSPIKLNERWELHFSKAARHQYKNSRIVYPDTLISCDAEVYGAGRN
ncbi:MAG TPA: vWA domain-containing protein [Candidatus Acidoferrum sp.]|nr:vWA domain-containing protein [Candidatus Acidoferrum sp.]